MGEVPLLLVIVLVTDEDGAVAYPARRITELARSFGENGLVQSICQDDFGAAVGFILEHVARRMRDPS